MAVDSGIPFARKHTICRVESRMQDYTDINPPMESKAASDKSLFGTTQGILLVVVCDKQDVRRTVQLPIVLVPGLE